MRGIPPRAVLLLPWIGLAAARVSAGFRRYSLDELPARLSSVTRLPEVLRDPHLIVAIVDRALRFLPPHRMGRCLKRSLLLLDLLSRCGLEPEFHLGLGFDGDIRLCHAWITVEGHPDLSADGRGYREILSQSILDQLSQPSRTGPSQAAALQS